jgi:hypothetical protein
MILSHLDLLPSSTLHHQPQLTPRSGNHQSQNPLLQTQTSQSFSHSTVTPPPSAHPMNTALSTDCIKQAITHSSSSSSSIVPETIETIHTPISPSQTNEISTPSESTTQPPVR